MKLVHAYNPRHFRHYTHRNPVFQVLSERSVTCPVRVNHQLEALVAQGLQRRKTACENVHHHVFSAMRQHVLRSFQHGFGFRRDVHHVHFALACFLLCLVPALQSLDHTLLKRIKPLTAQVLVILNYVASASPSLVSHLRMVNGF